MEHKHKIKKRKNYKNKKSYDAELETMLFLLSKCEKVEKELVDQLEESLHELVKLYKEEFPFYFKNGVLNQKEWEKLFASLTNGRGGIESRINQVITKIADKTRELQSQRLMAWLILDYEIAAQRTAASMNVDYTKYIWLMSDEFKRGAVLSSWCADGKTFLDRIYDNTKDMERKLRAVILKGTREGWSVEKMAEYFRTITGTAAYKAQRLLRTETTAVYSKATKEMFLANGIEYVEIIGDALCGEICTEFVGEAVPLRDAGVGIELPPYHPNCACSFCSYTEF